MAKEDNKHRAASGKETDEEALEGAESTGDLEAEPKKKIGTKTIAIIAVGGLVLVGGITVAAIYITKMMAPKEAVVEQQATADTSDGTKGKKAVFFPLGDLLVNLSGEGKRPNFLKVKISLELADEKDVGLMDALKPRIIDNFQVYLRELRIEDLRGSAGMYRLREALLLRVTEAAQPIRIRDVLFQEMLVQ